MGAVSAGHHPSARVVWKQFFRRLGIFAMGLGWVTMAFSFWEIRESEAYFPLLWPFWFGVTAALMILFAAFPWNSTLCRYAGAFGIIGFGSRLGAIYLNWRLVGVANGWRSVIAGVVYAIAVGLLWRFWTVDVRPWSRMKHKEHLHSREG